MLVDIAGHEKGILASGEQKSIKTDRVLLVPGPAEEVEVVLARMEVELQALLENAKVVK